MKTFGIVGLGLMGGSFAKAIKNCSIAAQPFIDGGIRILACDKDDHVLNQAREEGIINDFFLPESVDAMLKQCDVVFICLYPKYGLDFLISHQNSFKANSIVTDIAGIKTHLFEKLPLFTRTDVDFIPAHPMAGSEKEGYTHSSADIFKGRNYIFIPLKTTDEKNLVFLENLAYAMGFSRTIRSDAKNHDYKIAFTSQLCHVIASVLVDSATDTDITAFGGGSYEDLTRIAMINAPLWTELFTENKTELLAHIEAFEKNFAHFKQLLQNNDSQNMQSLLQNVRKKRIEMNKGNISKK
ncbi:MAG: prephenate dehydrogenase [Spirochaetales bacterium]